jgi:hypothetical protein
MRFASERASASAMPACSTSAHARAQPTRVRKVLRSAARFFDVLRIAQPTS